MKALLFLFGIYLLALGCLPCADNECAGQGMVIEAKASHNSDCKGEENCPPFCTCSCCSIQITTPSAAGITALPLQQPTDTRKIIFDKYLLLPGSTDNIWQPPRLG